MKKGNAKYYIIGAVLVISIALAIYSFSGNKSKGKRGIIIGDSQSPYIAKQSQKAKLLHNESGENALWKVGQNLFWLLNAVKKYPVTKDVGYVVVSIGTNGGFNTNDNIKELVKEIERVFPNATLIGVKGSWGWGNNTLKNGVDESKVNKYYNVFSDLGVKIVPTPIGENEPHGDRPSYKKIGKELDNLIK